MTRYAGALVLVLLAGPVAAQTLVPNPPPPTTRVCWTHDGVDVSSWQLRIDGAAGVVATLSEGEDLRGFRRDERWMVRVYGE